MIYINRAGQNLGTFSIEEVQRGLDTGRFLPTDLGWQQGMGQWEPLANFPTLAMPSSTPAPVVPAGAGPDDSQSLALTSTEATAQDCPAWERRRELGFGRALFETWREVLFSPGPTFSRLKTIGGFASPCTFQLVMLLLYFFSAIINQFAWTGISFAFQTAHRSNAIEFGNFGMVHTSFRLAASLLLGIPLTLGFSFVWAAIIQFCLTLLGSAARSYQTTYRVLCYATSALIFTLIPCIGGLVAIVWSLLVSIVGLAKAHRTETWKAAMALLLPGFICTLLILGISAAALALVLSHMHAQGAET
ncbi:MAG: YIP1 family protein [Verrucomicrobia bacterium]|nr:YIP1 family protein [Verrucomicrobiota bacterium]